MKIFTAHKFYECYKCRGQIIKGETYIRYALGATAHERCYDKNKEPFILKISQESRKMNKHNLPQPSADELAALIARLVQTTVVGQAVYVLDDIQGVLTKLQFAEFMAFLRQHHIETSADEESYVPVAIVTSDGGSEGSGLGGLGASVGGTICRCSFV